jgi:hypothetical protein
MTPLNSKRATVIFYLRSICVFATAVEKKKARTYPGFSILTCGAVLTKKHAKLRRRY